MPPILRFRAPQHEREGGTWREKNGRKTHPESVHADVNTRYRPVEIKSLVKRVLEKWDAFFANHGL